METVKPIQTMYNGYLFRSRLEARWAVFFDAAGIKYKYENEGYELPDGSYYLPDFEVQGNDGSYWFVECKGQFDEEGLRKANILDDYPPPFFMGVIIVRDTPSPYIRKWYPAGELTTMEYVVLQLDIDTDVAIQAALRARQARFEHGETPLIVLH